MEGAVKRAQVRDYRGKKRPAFRVSQVNFLIIVLGCKAA